MGFLILAIAFFILSILFLFWPQAVTKINTWGNRLLFKDDNAVRYRIVTGVVFLLIAGLMLFFKQTNQ